MIEKRLTELVHSIAAAFGARATLHYERVYPATDQPRPRGDVRGGRRRVAGRARQRRAQPRPVDGLRGLLLHAAGQARAPSRASGRAAPTAAASCTTARYDFNDAVIPLGAGLPRRARRDGDAARDESHVPHAAIATPTGRPTSIRRHFAADLRARRARSFLAAARAAASTVARARASRSRAAREGEELADRRRRARAARCARACCCSPRARTASRASAARGCQVESAARRRLRRERRATRRARRLPARAQPVRLLAPAPHQRGQRRPQPQLPRLLARRSPPNAAYAEVHGFMVPATWPPSPRERGAARRATSQERGERALQAAVTGGQCEFADGLFYGGVRPAWSNHVAARGAARRTARGARDARLDRLPHRPRARAATARRSSPGRDDRRRCRARQGVVGRRT